MDTGECESLNEFWLKYALSQRGLLIITLSKVGLAEINLMHYITYLQEHYRESVVIYALHEAPTPCAKHVCQQLKIPLMEVQ